MVDYHKRQHTTGRADDGLKIERLRRILKLEVESRDKTQPRKENGKAWSPKGSAVSLSSISRSKHTEPCALCAAKNHVPRYCQTYFYLEEKKGNRRIKCKTCERTHSTQMCDPSWKQSKSTATELHSVTAKKSDKTHTVLLHTAQVSAEGRQKITLARILFDGGSQPTFVTT